MSYTDAFGDNTLPPTGNSYLSLVLTANKSFNWSWDTNDTNDALAKVVKLTSSAAFDVTLPPANNCSIGEDFMIYNVGSYTLTIKKNDGSTLITIAAGEVVYFVVSGTSTAAGSFDFFTFGAGSSSVSAGALIGYGVKAIGASLNQSHPVATTASGITLDSTYRAKLVAFTGGTATFSLTAVATLADDFFVMIRNSGSGTLTLDPNGSELIDGATTLQVQPGESLFLVCSGTAWYSVGYGRSALYQFTQLTKDVSAGGTITLAASEAANKLITFIGNPAANLNVVIPAVVAVYYLSSAISTARQITFKTASGTGVTIAQNSNMIVLCDGTNVVSAQSANSNASVSLSDGSALLPALFFASQTNTGVFKSSTLGLGVTINGSLLADFQPTGTTFAGTSPVVTAKVGPTTAQQHTIPTVSSDTFALLNATQVFQGKTYNMGVNTFTGSKAQFNTACSDDDFAFLGAANIFTQNQTLGGNLILSGTARRITGDFSNATLANRVMLQTSTVDAQTTLGVLPNGTVNGREQAAGCNLFETADPANGAYGQVALFKASDVRLGSFSNGTGTYLPMTFWTGNAERMQIDTAGNVGIGTTPAITGLDIVKAAGQIRLSDGTIDSRIYPSAGVSFFGAQSNHPVGLMTNGTERYRVGTAGQLGIGGANYGMAGQVLTSGGPGAAPSWSNGGGLGATPSMVRLNTANGYGSTNTKIRRFTNVVTNQGTDISYVDSATLGASFTVNTAGVYAISYCDNFNTPSWGGVSLNTASPTGNIDTLSVSEILALDVGTNSTSSQVCVSWTGYLPASSIIRAHTNGATVGGTTNGVQFTISRVG